MGVSLLGTKEKPWVRMMPWNQQTEQGDGAKGLDMASCSAMKERRCGSPGREHKSWEVQMLKAWEVCEDMGRHPGRLGRIEKKKEGKPRETWDRCRAAGFRSTPTAAVKVTLITPSHPQPPPWS